jgi:Ca2+-binding EF-hand superfamily protein
MRNLKFRISRRDVEEMLWEVDEDLDGALAWTELRLLFTRNVLDRTGLEPSRMFNLVQFLIYDDNANGKVSLDETMHMLFVRYGKRELESKLKEIFGTQSEASPGVEGGGITFAFYLQAVEKVQMQMFHNSAQGKLAAKTLK